MTVVQILAWCIALYVTGGVLTILALASICRSESRMPAGLQPGFRRSRFLATVKAFALWPAVWLMAAVFAIIMLGQRRQ